MAKFIHEKWEIADKSIPPDPGRVTARRLNRSEYSNTVRDLLGVDFRAEKDFPTDDSGYGFDNIGDVLTISPVLMEKYIDAAERIAARAIGADPLPKKPLRPNTPEKTTLFAGSTCLARRSDSPRRLGRRVCGPHRSAGPARRRRASRCLSGFWMDGKKLDEQAGRNEAVEAGLLQSVLGRGVPPLLAGRRPRVPRRFHQRRVRQESVAKKTPTTSKKNKFMNLIIFVGPFPSKIEKPSRKKILTCDPKTAGDPCAYKIVSTLARRAYRRPVTKNEVDSLLRFVALAKTEGLNRRAGHSARDSGDAGFAAFPFPHRARSTADPLKVHPISELELASRLSYFLWRRCRTMSCWTWPRQGSSACQLWMRR